MATSPSLLAITVPSGYLNAAIARLQQTASDLSAEAGRTASAPSMTWHTLIGRHDTPSPYPDVGRFGSWLQAAALMAQRAVLILQKSRKGNDLTTGEIASINTASNAARAGEQLCFVLARRSSLIRPEADPIFESIDAMRWGRLHKKLHADLEITRKEFLPVTKPISDWEIFEGAPIRADSDGQSVINTCRRDILAYGDAWDVLGLAERLAAGIEVTF